MGRATLIVGVALLGMGCTQWRTYNTEAPDLTCWWLNVVIETGPDVTRDDGLGLADLVDVVDGIRVPIVGDGGAWRGSLDIHQVERFEGGSVSLLERRLPPNGEVVPTIPGTTCLEGTLIQGTVNIEADVVHPELGSLPIDGQAQLEGSGTDLDQVSLSLVTGWTVWADVPLGWRALAAASYPEDTKAKRAAAQLLMDGSLAQGALEIRTAALDGWWDPVDPVVAARIDWP